MFDICRKYNIHSYTKTTSGINSGMVVLSRYNLYEIPIEFNEVSNFLCCSNKLESMINGPKIVNNVLDCGNNNIKTLKYFPEVKGNIFINNNPLPKEIYDNEKYIKEIIKHQYDYGIWNYNDTLNKERFNLLMSDIRNNFKNALV